MQNVFGQAKNSWLTGTAAWNYITITQWILGIKPDYEGLKIDPCIPSDWSGYTIHRHFRNADYTITIDNQNHVSKGIENITVDGELISGNIIPVFNDGQKHDVHVLMG